MAPQVAVYAFPPSRCWPSRWPSRSPGDGACAGLIAAAFYVVSGLGITVGFHPDFTDGSFSANRPLKISLAAAGQMAVQGPVIIWVADHRRHHAFSDREGDPHSPDCSAPPWRRWPGVLARAHGLDLRPDMSNQQRFAPDLLAGKVIVRANKYFWVWTIVSVFGPAGVGAG